MQRRMLVITTLALVAGAAAAVTQRLVSACAAGQTATNAGEPLMCTIDAMTPAQRAHYDTVRTNLIAGVREIKELPNGYALRYAAEPARLTEAAEFIEGERQCCPFYTFTLEVGANNGPIWLRITGPKAAKSFIRAALADGSPSRPPRLR